MVTRKWNVGQRFKMWFNTSTKEGSYFTGNVVGVKPFIRPPLRVWPSQLRTSSPNSGLDIRLPPLAIPWESLSVQWDDGDDAGFVNPWEGVQVTTEE